MNWEAIGAVGEILGAIAVFCSLLYLALQIRSSNNIARIEGRENAIERLHSWRGRLLLDERLDDIWERGCLDRSSLEDKEQRHFDQLSHEMFMNMRVQYMRAYDLKHEDEMKRMESLCVYWSGRNGFVESWKHNRTPLEQPCLEMFERVFGKRAT
jgi:hypothetical protein